MRLLILTVALIFLSPGFIFGQVFNNPPCNIASYDSGFVTPFYDSLPCIERGQAYYQSIQISMPNTFNGVIQIDSIVINSITGFPSGIQYQQNPSSGVYYADSNGCIAFAGTSNDSVGAYQLTFSGYAVVTTQNSGTQTYSLAQLRQIQDAPVPVYYLNVINQGDSCFPQPVVSGISNLLNSNNLKVYPNPNNGSFAIELNAEKSFTGQALVTDLTGRVIYQTEINSNGLYNSQVKLSGYAKGLYLLQLKTSLGTVSKPISIQ